MSELLLPTDPPADVRGGILLPETSYERRMAMSIDADPGFRRIPIDQWPELIKQGYNCSYWIWTVLNQDGVGSCAAESKDGGIMAIREKQGLKRVALNPWGTYGRVNGGSDRGSTLSANLAFGKSRGAFPEEVWPRSKGWRAEPSSEAYEAAKQFRIEEYFRIPDRDWEAFGSALLNGYVVYWGYSGHAILAVDLVDTDEFIYLNSWGQWGGGTPHNNIGYGFGKSANSSIMWAYGAYAFQSVVHEVAP